MASITSLIGSAPSVAFIRCYLNPPGMPGYQTPSYCQLLVKVSTGPRALALSSQFQNALRMSLYWYFPEGDTIYQVESRLP